MLVQTGVRITLHFEKTFKPSLHVYVFSSVNAQRVIISNR